MLLGPLALDLQTERWRRLCRRNRPSEHYGDGNLPGPAGFLVLSRVGPSPGLPSLLEFTILCCKYISVQLAVT